MVVSEEYELNTKPAMGGLYEEEISFELIEVAATSKSLYNMGSLYFYILVLLAVFFLKMYSESVFQKLRIAKVVINITT